MVIGKALNTAREPAAWLACTAAPLHIMHDSMSNSCNVVPFFTLVAHNARILHASSRVCVRTCYGNSGGRQGCDGGNFIAKDCCNHLPLAARRWRRRCYARSA
jgi:hypothetical protein